jgi:hypothetical protein
MASFRMRLVLRNSEPIPNSSRSRQIRRPTTRATQNDQLLLEQEILRDDRPHATVTRQSRDHDDQVQQRDQDTCHVRVSVGQPSAAAQRCRIVYSAPKLAIRDPQVRARSVFAQD